MAERLPSPQRFCEKKVRDDGNADEAGVSEVGVDFTGVLFGDIPSADEFDAFDAGNGGGLADHFRLGRHVLVAGWQEAVAGVTEVAEDD